MANLSLTHGPLRVLYVNNMPDANADCLQFPSFAVTHSCPFPGLHVEILKIVAAHLNLTIQPVFLSAPPPGLEQSRVAGSVTARVLHYVQTGLADTVAVGIGKTPSRSDTFDFSVPLYYSMGNVFVNVPRLRWRDYFVFFDSYQESAWLGILLALLLQCVLCVVVQKVENRLMNSYTHGVVDSIWQILRLQLMQPDNLKHKLVSGKFPFTAGKFSLLVFSLVQCAVVMGVLSSYIFSTLIRRPEPLPFRTVEQLARLVRADYLHVVDRTHEPTFFEMMRGADGAQMRLLADALHANPVRVGRDTAEVLAMLDQPGAVTIQYDDEFLAFFAHMMCNVHYTDALIPPRYAHYIFQRGSPLLGPVNRIINAERFQIKRLWNKYIREYRRHIQCEPNDVVVIGAKYPYVGTGIVLFATELVGFVVFLLELLVHSLKGVSRRNRIESVQADKVV